MILNERKIKILQAIIDDYVATAEPVGSRTIAKKYNLGVSSATIRNEMSDLEELGLIVQPHLSAGRIPSDKGYRLYVDELMQYKKLEEHQIKILEEIVENSINQIDYFMKETAKAVSLLTKYTTIVSKPSISKTKLKHIQLIPLDENSIIVVSVMDNNLVQNHVINIKNAPEEKILNKLSLILNKNLLGLTLEEITLPLIQKIKKQMGNYNEILNPILDYIADAAQKSDDIEVSLSGAKNILDYPEFNDVSKAKILFQTLEEKDILNEIVNKNGIEIGKIQITIGDENIINEIKECSLIKTTYTIGDKELGTIGILGPTRMNYAQVVSMLSYINHNIEEVLRRLSGG